MNRLVDACCRGLEVLMAIALAVMVVMVFGNVVLRYAFNSGITVSEELSRWLFVWLTFMGAVVALKDHAHLGSDMLVSRLPRAGKTICLVLSQALMLFITWLMLRGSWEQTRINWDVEAPVTGASMAVLYGAGVVFAVLTGAVLLLQLARALRGQLGDKDLVMVRESEEAAELEAVLARQAADDAAAGRTARDEGSRR